MSSESLAMRLDEERANLEDGWHLPWLPHAPENPIWSHPLVREAWNLPQQELLALVSRLMHASSHALRGIAMHLVSDLRLKSCAPTVRRALDDQAMPVRAMAVRAIATLRDEEALEALLETKDEEHREVRKGVLLALSALGDARAIPLITRWVGRAGEDDELRALATETLGKLGDEAAMPVLGRLLKDPAVSPRVRGLAALSIGQITTEEGWTLLAEVANGVDAGCEEKDLIRAMGHYDRPEALSRIDSLLSEDTEDDLFAAAFEASLHHAERRGLQSFENAWRRRGPAARRLMARALGTVGRESESLRALRHTLDDPDPMVLHAAVEAASDRLGRPLPDTATPGSDRLLQAAYRARSELDTQLSRGRADAREDANVSSA